MSDYSYGVEIPSPYSTIFSFILSMDTPSIPYIITVVLYRMFSFVSYLSLCLHRSTEVRLLYTFIYYDTDLCSHFVTTV